MKESEILNSTEATLPAIAGEVLQPDFCKPCACYWTCVHTQQGTGDSPPETCNKIELTPANAFKWRDWAVEKFGEDYYLLCLFVVWEYKNDDYKEEYRNEYLHDRLESKSIESLDIEYELEIEFYKWIAIKIQPFDEILAACLCAEQKGNSDE